MVASELKEAVCKMVEEGCKMLEVGIAELVVERMVLNYIDKN